LPHPHLYFQGCGNWCLDIEINGGISNPSHAESRSCEGEALEAEVAIIVRGGALLAVEYDNLRERNTYADVVDYRSGKCERARCWRLAERRREGANNGDCAEKYVAHPVNAHSFLP
jgi:hypothetical protein